MNETSSELTLKKQRQALTLVAVITVLARVGGRLDLPLRLFYWLSCERDRFVNELLGPFPATLTRQVPFPVARNKDSLGFRIGGLSRSCKVVVPKKSNPNIWYGTRQEKRSHRRWTRSESAPACRAVFCWIRIQHPVYASTEKIILYTFYPRFSDLLAPCDSNPMHSDSPARAVSKAHDI